MKLKSLIFLIFLQNILSAHFEVAIANKDIVQSREEIEIKTSFIHPFSRDIISKDKPMEAKVFVNGKSTDLLNKLYETKEGWNLKYKLNSPSDYQFVVTNKPYFEKSEDKFIKHSAKVIVNGYFRESSWDEPVGLKVEIVPLTRPYTILNGMLFQGKVLFNGEVVPNAEVEVEYYNDSGKKVPNEMFNTLRIKADERGVFSFVFPFKGWWGFSALLEDEKKMKHNGKEYPVELGAVIWIEAK